MFSDNPEVSDAARNAAISGAVSGGVMGSVGPLLSSTPKNWRKMLIESLGTGLVGAGISGTAAGGGTLLGSAILGAPKPDDASAFTRRATLGSVLGGGVGGALLGAASSKFGRLPKSSPYALQRLIQRLGSSKRPTTYGAAVGGAMGGIGAAGIGSDEGMQVDFINNELRRQRMKKLLSLESEML